MPSNSPGRSSRRTVPRRVCSIGVTGAIGSGKSTVCRLLMKEGFPVLSADEIARELQERDAKLRRKVARLLGQRAYASNGRMNRAFVASRIFGSAGLRKKLERIVHPAVRRELKKRMKKLFASGRRVVIVEAALIFESGLDQILDLIVVVEARRDLRLARLRKRDRNDATVRGRMAAQWSPREKAARADILIRNDDGLSTLRRNVALLTSVLSAFARRS